MGVNENFRIFEKTYQNLTQAAGRAGRLSVDGKIIIQSFDVNHPSLQAMISNVEDHFYKEEIVRRKKASLPPFSKQIAITVSSDSDERALDCMKIIKNNADEFMQHFEDKIAILGPSPELIFYLKRQYHYKLLLQCVKINTLREFTKQIVSTVKQSTNVKIKIDVNPI